MFSLYIPQTVVYRPWAYPSSKGVEDEELLNKFFEDLCSTCKLIIE